MLKFIKSKFAKVAAVGAALFASAGAAMAQEAPEYMTELNGALTQVETTWTTVRGIVIAIGVFFLIWGIVKLVRRR
ncbi:hypothetical protein OH491_07760 [Termitidicoccus mucosus]|uniref:Uncharacterized protein n=1 Tax=Termitidicoccus mucosus TaxID=1184151 RepID=A0A178IDE5_9BACT|nr:hypothetical protein AW736_21295 [Opitutaceae bacterium TSB47]